MSKNIERAMYSASKSANSTSTSDQDCVFAQLTDMFGDVASPDLISSICISNDWRVDDCIEQLIKHLEFYGSDIIHNDDEKTTMENNTDGISEYRDTNGNVDAGKSAERDHQESLLSTDNFKAADSSSNEDMVIESEEAVAVAIQDVLQEDQDNGQQVRLLGAIPKNINSTASSSDSNSSSNSRLYPTIDFSTILQKGFKEFVSVPSCSTTTVLPKKREASESPEVENVLKNINAGYKVMIIMRGAPGCGKSFLARTIVDRSVKGDYRNHIFGADDYFYDVNDIYVYKKDKLQEAHEFNHRRVRRRTVQGWSPIIVDNTNIKIWEMTPYVKYAVRNGYIIEILVPDTAWSHSAGKLAAKNRHGVPKETIEKMLIRFEPITVEELLKINQLKYEVPIPQLRHHPPLPMSMVCEDTRMDANDENKVTCTDIVETSSDSNSKSWGQYEDSSESKNEDGSKPELEPARDMPKPAREINRKKRNINPPSDQSEDMSDSNPLDDIEWKSYEEESNDFWQTNQSATIKRATDNVSPSLSEAKPQRISNRSEDSDSNIFNILKEQVGSLTSSDREDTNTEKGTKKIQRHKFDCKNENTSFAMIRQIYPNKQADGLWDLFEKCNGDVDWAVDILLKDDSCVDQEVAGGFNQEEFFNCRCDETTEQESNSSKELKANSSSPTDFKLPKQKSRKEKDKVLSVEMLEAKQTIEKQFKLDDKFYSSHVRKIRDLRHGIENDVSDAPTTQVEESSSANNAEEKDNDDDHSSSTSSVEDDIEMVEINLGNELINQLEGMFGTECGPKHSLGNFKTNVFMPKSLAKQLYALWIESLYNQIEEQRQTTIKDDEEFARILGNPATYAKYSNPPNNYKEILDMELAWNIYKSEFEDWRDSTPRDLASHLTQLKLCEIFPNIEKDTLLEIFAAHGNRFADTVEVLKASSSCNDNIEERLKTKEKELFEKVKMESSQVNNSQSGPNIEHLERPLVVEKKILVPEEAKRQVLKDFEECRNLAVHHSQLKAECFQKAKEAIQKGSTAVAVYYSQIASLHKTKVDMFNHKAANCIMEVHDLNQNNPDFIDLHYLHVVEALQCLDIFIDKHINKMKNICRTYKHLFIITGRGLHSASGVSTIKTKVKARLKQRNLKWSEVNPGLLKVKVFSASKYSKNI